MGKTIRSNNGFRAANLAWLIFLFGGILTACGGTKVIILPTLMPVAELPTVTMTPEPSLVPTFTPALTPSPDPTAVATPTPVPPPTLSPTPDPYAGWTINDLAARSYGGDPPMIEETLASGNGFTRYLIHYPSDGLTIYGFMNVPAGEGPFPVVLVLHGFVNPANYNTLAYTRTYADSLAQAGYLVIHPNYRDHPPSDNGPNEYRAGYAIDILNLVALVQQYGGKPGVLELANPDDISLWGHSMGGGIALRVITVYPDIRAAVLYGSMSGDEYKNYEKIFEWTDGRSGLDELAIPEADMARIAPINHLERIKAAVSIHHGTADSQVPPEWSTDLCQRLQALNKTVECFSYPGQPHTFVGEGDQRFRQRVLDFLSQ